MNTGGLAILLFGGLFIAAIAWIVARVVRGPVVKSPSCGRCRYDVTGLPTTTCPECGADLQTVGILQSGSVKPIGFFGWAILWTGLLPLPAFIASRAIIIRVPQQTVVSQRVSLNMPASQAFNSVLMLTPASGGSPASPAEQDFKATITLRDGSQHDLLVDAENSRCQFTDAGGNTVALDQGLSFEVIRQWLEGLGVDVTNSAVDFEIKEIMNHLPAPGPAGTGFSFSNTTSVLSYANRGFSGVSSSSSSTSRQPPHLVEYAWAASVGLWLLGLLAIWMLSAVSSRRRRGALTPLP